MLGIFLLYFIWKYYSELAVEFNKSKWGYGILGIAIYYLGTFVGGLIIGIVTVLMGNDIDSVNDILMSLIAIPFGLLSTWGLYKILQYNWAKKMKESNYNSLDSDLI